MVVRLGRVGRCVSGGRAAAGGCVPAEVAVEYLPGHGQQVGFGERLLHQGHVRVEPALGAGWYDLGPAPGQVGSAIIVGHVDSRQAPGVFYDLGSLAPGDLVEVTLANGETVHFTVTSVQEYPKAHFPASEVYGPEPYQALRLITCGDAFDEATGHYLSNIVAYARMN